jgi:hypothetical protein
VEAEADQPTGKVNDVTAGILFPGDKLTVKVTTTLLGTKGLLVKFIIDEAKISKPKPLAVLGFKEFHNVCRAC